jgi:hypothetical protein
MGYMIVSIEVLHPAGGFDRLRVPCAVYNTLTNAQNAVWVGLKAMSSLSVLWMPRKPRPLQVASDRSGNVRLTSSQQGCSP